MGPDPDVAAVRLAVRRELVDSERVMVACSGGADSLALLAAAVFEGRRGGVPVVGATIDHGLQDGSAEVADQVVRQMEALGADETVSARITVAASGLGIEAAAREGRYPALEELAGRMRCDVVLLGHTLDDQAETVLMGLTRGSGGRSIAGMRPSFGIFRRPLLGLTRAQTETACRAQGIGWWDDPHNQDPHFLRTRVRHTVMPLLEAELGPGVAVALARTADLLRDDMDALDALGELTWQRVRDHEGVHVPTLRAHPPAIRSRVVRRAALEAGSPASELFKVHVDRLDAMLDGPAGPHGEAQLPGGVTGYRAGEYLRFRSTPVAG